MRRAAFALLALLGATASVGQTPSSPAAGEVLRNCARTAPPDHHGLEQLRADCPELDAALAALGGDDALARGEQDALAPASLESLATLLERPAQGREPGVSALAPVLRELGPGDAPESWWSRFKHWFQELAGRDPAGTPLPRWLLRWLQGLSPGQAVLRALVLALEIGVVVLALFVAWRELKAAGVLGASRGGIQRGHGTAPEHATTEAGTHEMAPAAGAASLRPRTLFRLVAERLIASGRLPPERSLTHRELAAAARLTDAARREAWSTLAGLAEQEAYAQSPASTPVPASRLAEAAGLLLPPAEDAGQEPRDTREPGSRA